MKKWYTKYFGLLGDPNSIEPAIYGQISNSIARLTKDRPIEISVVMIAYNEAMRLTPAIWSLADQVCDQSVEIIVVDNASSDQTANIIRNCGARYIFQPIKGVGNARQAGLEAAQGAIIISADADTFYPVEYIKNMVRELQKPGIACVFAPYWFIDDGHQKGWQLAIYSKMRDMAVWLRSIKRPELAVGGAAMVFYRDDALKIGWNRTIRRGEDGSMVNSLKQFGKTRIHLGRSTRVRSTSRTLDSDGTLFQIIYKRIKREIKRTNEYFTTKKHYKDQDYNKLE